MNPRSTNLRDAPTPLTAYSLRQVLAISLVLALAIAGTVFLLANPTLAVGFVAGLLTAWARPKVPALHRRVNRYTTEVRNQRPPAGE